MTAKIGTVLNLLFAQLPLSNAFQCISLEKACTRLQTVL